MDVGALNLTWLRTFEAASRLLNFTTAASELGLTQTAVSLHIRSLETSLHCKLFIRKPRNLVLTELGQAYAYQVRKSLVDIEQSTAALFGSRTRRTITVRAPISTATLWLAPKLSEFSSKYPDIDIRLISNIWADSVSTEDVDVDIRLGRGDWSDFNVEKVSIEEIVPICATKNAFEINKPKDLLKKRLVHILGFDDHWETYLRTFGLTIDSDQAKYFVDTTVAACQIVAEGGGVATVVKRFVNSNSLTSHIQIIGEPVPFSQAHYLVHSSPRKKNAAEVEIFKSWVRRQFNQ